MMSKEAKLMKMVKNKDKEIANLKACIRDACYLNEGLKILLDQVDELLMTRKPMDRKVK